MLCEACRRTCRCFWPRRERKQVETFSSGSSRRPSHTRTLSLRGCRSKYSHRLCKEVVALITPGRLSPAAHSQPRERKWGNELLQLGPLHKEEGPQQAGG